MRNAEYRILRKFTRMTIGFSGAGLSDWVCSGISTGLEQSEVIVLVWGDLLGLLVQT